MFGQNKVVNPHTFDDLPANVLKVTSIFYTLQGEGPYAGRPAIFVRLALCNLTCSFCDTYFNQGDDMAFPDILVAMETERLTFYRNHGLPIPARLANFEGPAVLSPQGQRILLVITGGEPMLQQNVAAFAARALYYGYDVQIESNGMFYRQLPGMVHLVVSPKVNEKTRKYIVPPVHVLERADSLKIVVSPDVPGYEEVPEFALRWLEVRPRHYVYLTPMNHYLKQPALPPEGSSMQDRNAKEVISFWTPGLLDQEANKRSHEHAAYLAMKHGLRLSIQQHLFAGLP
jgi:7-carboxy-7-deazaguanine synthase